MKLKKIAWLILLAFLLINIGGMSIVVMRQAVGKPNSVAKAFMAGATYFNVLYVIPISKFIGFQNFIVSPFRWIRDSLYDIGSAILPHNDAERNIWWYRAIFGEFGYVVVPAFQKYANGDIALSGSERDAFLETVSAWTDKIYTNIEALAIFPLQDKSMQDMRFYTFVVMSHGYVSQRALVFSRRKGKGKLEMYFRDDIEMKRIRNILNWLDTARSIKELSSEKERMLTNKYNKLWYAEHLLINRASVSLILNDTYNDKFDCNKDTVILYRNSYDWLDNAMKNSERMSERDRESLREAIEYPSDSDIVFGIRNRSICAEK